MIWFVDNAVLYLASGEKKIFDELPSSVREGWKVEEETLEHDERNEEMEMRKKMFRCGSGQCHQLLGALSAVQSDKDLERLARETDFGSMPKEELAEILFTIGVGGITQLIAALLSVAKKDNDLEGVAGLTQIRRMLMESNAEVSPLT